MRMPRAAHLIAALSTALTLIGPGAGAYSAAHLLNVEVVKTERYIRPFGDVSSDVGRVMLRLHKRTPEGTWRKISSARARVKDGTYKGQLDRPRRGLCRVKAFAKTDGGRLVVHAKEIFGCELPPFGEGRATLSSVSSSTELDVWVADEGSEQAHGLMYRKWMPELRGMVFLFPEPTQGGFYMLNTHLPLSIAFFDDAGTIVDILHMEPCPDAPCPTYTSSVPYKGALEVNQGAFETWGISEGDTITVSTP
jgi:uncharacterized membrane protein (UPF0127 family)